MWQLFFAAAGLQSMRKQKNSNKIQVVNIVNSLNHENVYIVDILTNWTKAIIGIKNEEFVLYKLNSNNTRWIEKNIHKDKYVRLTTKNGAINLKGASSGMYDLDEMKETLKQGAITKTEYKKALKKVMVEVAINLIF